MEWSQIDLKEVVVHDYLWFRQMCMNSGTGWSPGISKS